jgi:hypothetical protein
MKKMNRIYIDFRLLKQFGLSLNTKKKYFISYDPQTWTMMGVYDSLEDIIRDSYPHYTIDDYYKCCRDGVKDCYKEVMDENFVGHNYHFYKGFYQNLNVWELLEMLCGHIKEDICGEGIEDSMDYTLSSIYPKLHSYPEYIEEKICTFAKLDLLPELPKETSES